jgi:D-tyrosyl-tRNA(Tyr) deacylase
MRAVVTRVKEAAVEIDGECRGKIEQGFLVLLGVAPSDSEAEVDKLATKVCNLRVFSDADGKMNLDLATVEGKLLIISQFTLFANFKSRRPGFSGAAKPEQAKDLYQKFLRACEEKGFCVEHGEFGADMQVSSINDGPVTLLLDTDMM